MAGSKRKVKSMKKQISIKMQRDKECKGSIRFSTKDEDAPITNVYISREVKEVAFAKEVTIYLEVTDVPMPGPVPMSAIKPADAALLASLQR